MAIALVLGLTGCGDERAKVPEQIAFKHQIKVYEEQNNHLG